LYLFNLRGKKLNQDILKNWDKVINWDKRLHHEIPFFREIFEENGIKKVLDACCGSGRHAIEFSKMGLDVVSIDCSDEILACAKVNTKNAGINIRLFNEDVLDLPRFQENEFDAIVCIGNSLALLDSFEDFKKAILNFNRILKKDGVIIIHLLDLNKLEETGQVMMPVISTNENGSETILCRVFHVSGKSSSYVTFIVLEKKDDKWVGKSYRQNLVRITQGDIQRIFQELHYEKVNFYSSFKKHPLEDKKFSDMIITAKKSYSPFFNFVK
jgi:ubiquinone/menaquinone biosynthesis C-methylase UbiE